MDIKSHISPEFWAFLQANAQAEVGRLALQLSGKNAAFDVQFALIQIQARQKALKKLPSWVVQPEVLFPSLLSVEQASSELAIQEKTDFFFPPEKIMGRLVDLSGGLGVDSWGFSRCFEQVIYVERDPKLVHFAQHNFRVLGANNIQTECEDAEIFLRSLSETQLLDVAYIDPARRDKAGGKVFRLADCSPNVVDLLPELKKKARILVLKASPMLDISQGVLELGGVERVLVISIDNEVKELVFFKDLQNPENNRVAPSVFGVSILHGKRHTQVVYGSDGDEPHQTPNYSQPLRFLYEPSALEFKIGQFNALGNRYGLNKLHTNTHLFTSNHFVPEFGGHIYEVKSVLKYHKKEITAMLPEGRALIKSRNFPDSPEKMYQKLGIKPGGTDFLFGATLIDGGLRLILARKVEGDYFRELESLEFPNNT